MARPETTFKIADIRIKSYMAVDPCVFKLVYNERYVIVKAKSMDGTCKGIQKSLNQFLDGSNCQRDPGNMYYHFFTYVEKNEGHTFSVQLIMETTNAYELLKAEQILLDGAKKNKKCLNNNVDAYIPQYNDSTDMYGWIPKWCYLSFMKWKKNRK